MGIARVPSVGHLMLTFAVAEHANGQETPIVPRDTEEQADWRLLSAEMLCCIQHMLNKRNIRVPDSEVMRVVLTFNAVNWNEGQEPVAA